MNDVTIYLVGGAVRDELMGLTPKDHDYAVEAPSYEVMRAWVGARGTIFQERPEYLTIRARARDGHVGDFVLCRKDCAYQDGRRPDYVMPGTLLDDLARRDFTMNAIARRPDDKVYIDPHNGQADIERKLVRCVGSARARIEEDPLRGLRAIRFAVTKGFGIDLGIDTVLRESAFAATLLTVSVDRVREELNKAFAADTYRTLCLLGEYPFIMQVLFMSMKLWLTATTKERR
jgi:tRNA nucleotidyltransferase (CCA-adding enzyme)